MCPKKSGKEGLRLPGLSLAFLCTATESPNLFPLSELLLMLAVYRPYLPTVPTGYVGAKNPKIRFSFFFFSSSSFFLSFTSSSPRSCAKLGGRPICTRHRRQGGGSGARVPAARRVREEGRARRLRPRLVQSIAAALRAPLMDGERRRNKGRQEPGTARAILADRKRATERKSGEREKDSAANKRQIEINTAKEQPNGCCLLFFSTEESGVWPPCRLLKRLY